MSLIVCIVACVRVFFSLFLTKGKIVKNLTTAIYLHLSLLYISIYNTLILTTLFLKESIMILCLLLYGIYGLVTVTLCGLYYYEIINIIVTNYIM